MKNADGYVASTTRDQYDALDPRRAQHRRIGRFLVAAALIGCLFAVACNTVEGAGKDVQSVGESTSEAARDVRDH